MRQPDAGTTGVHAFHITEHSLISGTTIIMTTCTPYSVPVPVPVPVPITPPRSPLRTWSNYWGKKHIQTRFQYQKSRLLNAVIQRD